jgi:quercetin dioxygenase-like cupin family protein
MRANAQTRFLTQYWSDLYRHGVLVSFDDAQERRTAAGGLVSMEVVHAEGVPVLRISHAPGWRWSLHSAPEAGVDRCPAAHVCVLIEGELAVEEADGTSYVLRPGDPALIPPGHDAWTVGSEPAVLVQFDEGDSARRRFGLS